MYIKNIALPKHRIYTGVFLALVILSMILITEFRLLDPYKIRIINLCAIYIILGLSMNLALGFGGLFQLGTAGFMIIGAYTSALLTMSPAIKEMNFFLKPIVPWLANVQTSFVVALFISGLLAAAAAFIIGAPALKLRGDYLAIATLSFAELTRVIITNTQSLTNGALGLKSIPPYTNLYWSWGLAIAGVILCRMMTNSSYGRAFKAIRDDQTAAEAMGINLFTHKVTIFLISAFMAGVGGALLGNLIGSINPAFFRFMLTFQVLLIVVLGGLGSITGTVIGGIVVTVGIEWLRIVESPVDFGFIRIPGLPGMRMVIFAILLLMVILFWQKGLMGRNELTWKGVSSLYGKIRQKLRSGKER